VKVDSGGCWLHAEAVRASCLLAVALVAFSFAVRAEESEIDVAEQALRDGLWKVARVHALRVTTPEAKLVVLESLAGEGNWTEIERLLVDWADEKGLGFDYYRAVVAGRHDEAMAILKKAGSAEGCVEALLYEAESLSRRGDQTGAAEIWRNVAAVTNVGERALAVASVNLMDAGVLRRAFAEMRTLSYRRMVGLRLGIVLMRNPKTMAEGERLIRTIVRDSPDADGAKEAFLAIADAQVSSGRWETALKTY